MSFLHTEITLKSFPREDQNLVILQSQYNGCWCHGETGCQQPWMALTLFIQNIPVSASKGLKLKWPSGDLIIMIKDSTWLINDKKGQIR